MATIIPKISNREILKTYSRVLKCKLLKNPKILFKLRL